MLTWAPSLTDTWKKDALRGPNGSSARKLIFDMQAGSPIAFFPILFCIFQFAQKFAQMPMEPKQRC